MSYADNIIEQMKRRRVEIRAKLREAVRFREELRAINKVLRPIESPGGRLALLSVAQQELLEVWPVEQEVVTAVDLDAILPVTRQRVYQILAALEKKGIIERVAHGRYRQVGEAELMPANAKAESVG